MDFWPGVFFRLPVSAACGLLCWSLLEVSFSLGGALLSVVVVMVVVVVASGVSSCWGRRVSEAI